MRKHQATGPELLREFLIPFWLAVKYTATGNLRGALPFPGMRIARILGYWEAMQKFNGRNNHGFEVRSN
jgi:hypothetical protein